MLTPWCEERHYRDHSTTLRQSRHARRHLQHRCGTSGSTKPFSRIPRHPGAVRRGRSPMHRHSVLARICRNGRISSGRCSLIRPRYTVDEHMIRVMLKLESFASEETRQRHPLCVDVWLRLPSTELIPSPRRFNDIAKGRGGATTPFGALRM
ncbi:hypothetical protein ACLK19_01260 [Escherichia coli]